jgi:hypothetical protein
MRRLRKAWSVVLAVVGADELVLALALALIVVGLWPVTGRLVLFIPGAVLLWIAMPSRQPFVHRSPMTEKPSTRRVT